MYSRGTQPRHAGLNQCAAVTNALQLGTHHSHFRIGNAIVHQKNSRNCQNSVNAGLAVEPDVVGEQSATGKARTKKTPYMRGRGCVVTVGRETRWASYCVRVVVNSAFKLPGTQDSKMGIVLANLRKASASA